MASESNGSAAAQPNGTTSTPTAGTPTHRDSRESNASRRASAAMPPPPLPLGIPSSSPSHVSPAPQNPSPGIPLSARRPSIDNAGLPMRHPRPLTAAELHLELETEQEAVVNRLTRELSSLRAHSASVASTTSTSSVPATSASGRQRSESNVSNTNPRSSSTSMAAGQIPTSASANPGSIPSTPRYEDIALQRAELESMKRENDRLKQKIRELEQMVRSRRASSVSTTASSLPATRAEASTPAQVESQHQGGNEG